MTDHTPDPSPCGCGKEHCMCGEVAPCREVTRARWAEAGIALRRDIDTLVASLPNSGVETGDQGQDDVTILDLLGEANAALDAHVELLESSTLLPDYVVNSVYGSGIIAVAEGQPPTRAVIMLSAVVLTDRNGRPNQAGAVALAISVEDVPGVIAGLVAAERQARKPGGDLRIVPG